MDEAKQELVRAWFWKAVSDLTAARILARTPAETGDAAIYHCQQAAEKAVKGLLVRHDVTPAKTHDIGSLMVVALPLEPGLAAWHATGARLTEYATDYRYPDEVGFLVPSEDELAEALTAAAAILEFVLSRMPAGCHPLPPGPSPA